MRGFIGLFSLFLFISALIGVPAVRGQGGATGAISGTVTDVSGALVADADLQIFNSATDSLVRRQSTGPDGSFVATLLPPGTYYLVVNKTGFSEAKATGIEVRVTETIAHHHLFETRNGQRKGGNFRTSRHRGNHQRHNGPDHRAEYRPRRCRWPRRTSNNC